MKKLSLLFLTLCVSLAGWAGVDDWTHLNPFAYDLKSEVIENGTQLKLTYSLNATAVTSDTYNEDHHGLQIYLIDENGNRIKKEDGTTWACTSGSYQKGKDHSVIIPIADLPPAAKDKLVSWEVVVHGNKNRTLPKVVYTNIKTDNSVYYPRAAHGIAVGKNPNKPNFAKLFTAEASTNTLSGKSVPNSLWEYNMQMKYQKYHHKDKLNGATSHFSSTTNYEPHRVKISDDGRIFATCYHVTATDAVVEYIGNGEWRTIVKANRTVNSHQDEVLYGKDDKYNRRPIAMDVKGEGENLKIIVAWMKPKGKKINNRMLAQIQVIEYEVGSGNYNLDQDNDGTVVAEYIDHDSDGNRGGTYEGMLFQSYHFGQNQALHGFIGVAYGDNNSIWLKVDFGFGTSEGRRSHILRYDQGSTEAKYTYTFPSDVKYRNSDGYYGGAGLLIKGNQLITGSGSNTLLVYTIKNDKTLDTNESNVKSYGCGSPGTSTWLDAITEDYAGNLYCISEAADNIVIFAMPYDGTRKTRASAEQSFTVSDPIPNILATDLRYEPVPNQPKYRFSFNVNTTPESAQIRFYKSYGDDGENDMKKNLAKINADDYQGGDSITPSFVYNIPEGLLKQGEIAVEFDMVGGKVVDGVLNDAALPRGEWYWSVYVEAPRKSAVFAPIYRLEGVSTNTGQKDTKGNDIYNHERRHATVNNYPETDMFGSIIVAHNPSVVSNDNNRPERGLKIYGINPNGNDEQSSLNNNTRYHQTAVYLNGNATSGKLHYPRRMAVAPDGKIYIADEGSQTKNDTHWKNVANGPVMYTQGGVKLWDPANPDKFTLFSDNKICLSTGVALWDNKLYATNTYNEYAIHFYGTTNYTKEQQENPSQYGWNGFVEYTKLNDFFTTSNDGTWEKFWKNNERAQEVALHRGDASGNNCLVAMDKGIWICQHREHTVAIKEKLQEPYGDNIEAYVLSFVPYDRPTPNNEYGPRTWRSSTTLGIHWKNGTRTDYDKSPWSQTTTSPLQSTPGAGLAYKAFKDKDGNILKDEAGNPHEYLYVVNHDGNIVVIQITQWTGNTPSLKYLKTLVTPAETKGDRTASKSGFTSQTWHTAFITSMNFDYAGNLVTTTGKGNHDNHQDIIVYTMPYDRVNAREIQAPNSCRMIPERIAHLDMAKEGLDDLIKEHQKDHPTGCAIDLYRPIQGGEFNTICLPYTLDLKTLPEGHPLYKAELKEYTGLNLNTVGGEKVLELVFTDVSDRVITANKPYIIQPEENYNSIIRFAGPLRLTSTTGEADRWAENSNNYNIAFQGIIPYQEITPIVQDGISLTLMLVADNRLAEMTTKGYMYGFRGYFQLNQPLPKGMRTRITTSKGTATNTTIVVGGKKVNVEKFIREGRVCVRVGDTLYNINGEVIGR